MAVAVVLVATPSRAQVVRQLTDVKTGSTTVPSIDDAGTEVFVSSSTDQLGSNAGHSFQLVRFTASSGAGAQLTTATDGIANQSFAVSVSDDDQWVAYLSRDNPTGQNVDRSPEVFVVKRDGTSLLQLTNHPGGGSGEPLIVAMAGGGTKVAFVSTGDLTGGNPDHHGQVFLVNKDGTGLAQVTALASGDIDFLGISDDATKIAFGSSADPFGTNADGSTEIFAINADGSNLKQLTTTSDPTPGAGLRAVTWMSFAGGGSKVAFAGAANPLGTNADRQSDVFVVDFAGTNLRQLTNSTAPGGFARDSEFPAITDDGVTVFFTSDQFTATQNNDGSFELWKIRTDGTGKALLTNNGIEYANLVVSGSGNRLAFQDVGGDGETKVIDATGLNLRTLTSTTRYTVQSAALDGAATRIVFSSRADMVPPGNAAHTREVFGMNVDGGALAQLTSGLNVVRSAITRDGSAIYVTSTANPLGTNADGSEELFRLNPDGSGLRQVTNLPGGSSAFLPAESRDGSVIVFASNTNLTGQNADGSFEEFKINSDGTGFAQLTSSPNLQDISGGNHIDDAGVWLTFESTANFDGAHPNGVTNIWRMKTDGTGLQALTNGGPTGGTEYPDITADGSTICFHSTFDLTGGNPDHNFEIFLWQSGSIRQVTSADEGDAVYCRFSGNGQWVYFRTNEPVFEDNPAGIEQAYRANVATGVMQRLEGLGFGASYDSPAVDYGDVVFPSPDDSGNRVAWALSTNATRGNPDLFKEVMFYDLTTPPIIRISPGPAPTRVSWDVESGPVRYDVIRGDLANVHLGATTVDLGAVTCVENDAAVASTEGSDDSVTPPPGHVFFYVYRGSPGLTAGPGSYGTGSGARERVPSSGGCNP